MTSCRCGTPMPNVWWNPAKTVCMACFGFAYNLNSYRDLGTRVTRSLDGKAPERQADQ